MAYGCEELNVIFIDDRHEIKILNFIVVSVVGQACPDRKRRDDQQQLQDAAVGVNSDQQHKLKVLDVSIML